MGYDYYVITELVTNSGTSVEVNRVGMYFSYPNDDDLDNWDDDICREFYNKQMQQHKSEKEIYNIENGWLIKNQYRISFYIELLKEVMNINDFMDIKTIKKIHRCKERT